MARPRSDDPVTNRNVGLPTSLWPKVDAAAKAADTSRSAWIQGLVRDALDENGADTPTHESEDAMSEDAMSEVSTPLADDELEPINGMLEDDESDEEEGLEPVDEFEVGDADPGAPPIDHDVEPAADTGPEPVTGLLEEG